ncbi:ABC transporter permease [Alkalibacterium kapii]|uniref:ABC transporter permease n=1 Tax=Alkalibacterium kapii TaxID=426704 RepID=UPI001FE85C26|nr:FtsX-like permease family protein [Alkalibacterium kapii]
MKKSALWKDTFREITRSKTRFLSIFAIILIGVAFYAGLSATGPVMNDTADSYYDEQNLSDLHVFSTMGLADEDKELLDSVENAEINYLYTKDVILSGTGLTSKVYGWNENLENVNTLKIIEGRLPEATDEIALDHTSNYADEYAIGDSVTFNEDSSDDQDDVLTERTFEVVGFVKSPLYIERSNRGNTTIGNGNLDGFSVVLSEVFDMDIYTDAHVLFDQSSQYESYTEDYQSFIKKKTNDVEEVFSGRPEERYDKLYEEIETEINDGYTEIEDAKQELEEGRQELKDSRNEIDEGYADYEAGLDELESEEANARAEIENERDNLNQALNEVQANKNQLREAQREGTAAYQQLQAQEEQIIAGLEELDNAENQLEQELTASREELEQARVELEEAEADYQEGLEEFKEEEAKANKEIEEAQADLADAEEQLAELEEPEYFVKDRTSNPGYEEFSENADRISAIAKIFPVFFFMLAALISLTTMTRMVDEGRNQIGTLKALGYGNTSIAAKYFIYAFIATSFGSVIGLFLGYWLFPNVILDAYSTLYNLPEAQTQFYWNYALISIIAALLATGLSTLVSVRLSLRSNAATLLRPKAPKKGKRIFLERLPFIWKRFSFTQKVSSRNLFRYKRRMLMTLFGVAGGTALLLTGFGLSDSIADITDLQFGEINLYQAIVTEDPNATESEQQSIAKTLDEVDGFEEQLQSLQESVTVEKDSEMRDATLLVPDDKEMFKDFVVLRDRNDQSIRYDLKKEGAVITDKLADLLDVNIGDTVEMEWEEGETATIDIAGISEQYVEHYVYMSKEYYEQVIDEDISYNTSLLKYEDSINEDELGEKLTEEDGVLGITFVSSIKEEFQDSMDSLDIVTVVLIISAASLAFVVLYNLTNINVSERIRELSTIKVLGFYDKEVTMYVYRENFVLTVMGILVGFVLGIFMHQFVLQTAELDVMRFVDQIAWSSYLYSFLLMFFFSSLVMIVMHFKLKNVDMVEALKTQD